MIDTASLGFSHAPDVALSCRVVFCVRAEFSAPHRCTFRPSPRLAAKEQDGMCLPSPPQPAAAA
eukprot:7388429-Prymnesium_polylepis.1